MEQKLKRLFDYQRFQKNPRLEAMLSEAEGRYDHAVSDDDLELVSAAGDSKRTIVMIFNNLENDQ